MELGQVFILFIIAKFRKRIINDIVVYLFNFGQKIIKYIGILSY